MTMKLFTYWRSTAAYRVRAALHLKGLAFESESIHLVKNGGEQHGEAYRAINPQGLVPALVTESGQTITQSMAIMEYLEAKYPDTPILPESMAAQAECRAMAQMVVSDVHPLNNLRVMKYLKMQGWEQDQVDEWYAHWIHQCFTGLETMAQKRTSSFLNAEYPCISDICLVGQIYNANRFSVPMSDYPELMSINARCLALDAFQKAIPENQLDAGS